MSDAEPKIPRLGKQLLDATRPFAVESTIRSWWCVVSTLGVLGVTLFLAATAPWWPLRLATSALGGLLIVRVFILYHDFMHGALLRESRLAKWFFSVLGLLLLTPPRYWRYSHNYHHGNVGRPLQPDSSDGLLLTSDLGSFPLMGVDRWPEATFWQRLRYRIARHSLTLLFAYITVFLFSLCILPLVRDPRKYWDGALSATAHGALIAVICVFAGFPALFFSMLLPFFIASAAGAYLFFAQHNYEGMRVLTPDEWSYYRGATESSSYMMLGRVMHWFTGNIGYHHVHHLNPRIPFYRLPDALSALPELEEVQRTTLRFRDIFACLRLHLWDPEQRRLVTYRDAKTRDVGRDGGATPTAT